MLRDGGIVGVPTDTQYALAADGLNDVAVQRVFEAKGRLQGMALPLLMSSTGDLYRWSVEVPGIALMLAKRYWPGALTLVLRKAPDVPDMVTAGLDTVALRVPDHKVPRTLAMKLGRPITGTSANATGQQPFTDAEEVRRHFGGSIDYVVDGGAPGGEPSTIVDVTGHTPRIVREGAIFLSEIGEVAKTAARRRVGP